MKITKNKKAFTFVELIVASVILVILSSIGFYSYTGLLSDSRDSQRKSDLASLKTAFKTYNKKRGFYPLPGDSFNILDTTEIVAKQGKLNKFVILSSIDEIPYDPFTKTPYFYSITNNKQEFQIALTIENGDNPVALLVGDYKTVRRDVIPTIMLAYSGAIGDNIEIKDGQGNGSMNRLTFIFDKGAHNLPYELISPYLPYTDGTSFTGLIDDPQISFWQNSDFLSCSEIKAANKFTANGQYQILSSTGILTNTGCTNP